MKKLCISNIAWSKEYDEEMYEYLSSIGCHGLEIAPTRIFDPSRPYSDLNAARELRIRLKEKYDISIPSMQSIWYGITENIFGSEEDRQRLVEYTKKAVAFAAEIGCGNLVFGCPKNRNKPDGALTGIALDFFARLGEIAEQGKTVLALEPNPPIYNTNFINTTSEALEFVKALNMPSVKVNMDIGTIIYNDESIIESARDISLINHIHLSEPYLAKIETREQHKELGMLDYNGFISIEMRDLKNVDSVKETLKYAMGLI